MGNLYGEDCLGDLLFSSDWSSAKDQRLLQSLLPKHRSLPLQPPAKTPLQSQIKAWQRWLNFARASYSKPTSYKENFSLALLDEPFPREIALHLTDSLEVFIEEGIIVEYFTAGPILFAFIRKD